MSEGVEAVRKRLLAEYGGDVSKALDHAVRSYLWAVGNMSSGMARVNVYPSQLPAKDRDIDPVLLSGET